MKKILLIVMVSTFAMSSYAEDTYGYLVFWQNQQDKNEIMQIKTTKENASQIDAQAEMRAYCRVQDTLAGIPADDKHTGCQFVMPLHNTCVAAAFPSAENKITPDNAVVISSPRFKSVHQLALTQCMKKYGTQGQCDLKTVYCTSSDYYGGMVKTLLNRLK